MSEIFTFEKIYDLFKYVKEKNIDTSLMKNMLCAFYEHPKMDFDSVLASINFKKISKKEIVEVIPFLRKKFNSIRVSKKEGVDVKWIMGELHKNALGNINLKELKEEVDKVK